MRIVVTGAPGWLGTEIVRRFDGEGHEIRCLTLEGVDTSELDQFDIEVSPGDVRRPETLKEVFEGGSDAVVHAAGIIHPPKLFGANLFYDINSKGTENLLESAREHGCDYFIYISSNAAQGFNDSPENLMTEDMPCEPESPYGRSKYQAEEHVRRYGREYGLDYTIIRPCWYYGPRQPERMATLMQMVKGGNPLIFGDGQNLRSMTYIPALVDAIQLTLDQSSTALNETYWIADEEPYTTNHIYETIAECLGVAEELNPRYIPKSISKLMEVADKSMARLGMYEQHVHVAGEMSRTIACDPSKAMSELGYEPPSRLKPGMSDSVEWAREHGQV